MFKRWSCQALVVGWMWGHKGEGWPETSDRRRGVVDGGGIGELGALGFSGMLGKVDFCSEPDVRVPET